LAKRYSTAAVQASVDYAFAHPEQSKEYICQHSQEMDAVVISSHIALYVNEFSRNLGQEGRAAVEYLLARGREKKFFS